MAIEIISRREHLKVCENLGINWLEIYKPLTGKELKRRESLYRDRKEKLHTTVNGRGKVARLTRKK
ncbi:MAG: hypothetical protein UY28_C0004G0062 [Candidatus Amesbacteria bacterium GW2011_GWB1_48_13]|uniref:Uncharacterized protein n=1 Tax=Candidatus Amesbacteria bacterium GW2011_GWB1_48_13 TaxID=1618362 RepID=A0A0G1UVM6_9BACT|nr:MAG: hypothetical protein UY28_C0004G0062 [Candidatus Amesbacteria bacterium GW2011_GWB1_48_13]